MECVSVALKKPPLVEVWMSFRFEPAAGVNSWTRERYLTFLGTLSDSHPEIQEMTRHAIRVASKRGTHRIKEIAEEVMAMRAMSGDGFRAVQLTPDELLVNYLRGEGLEYPGFEALLDEALGHCRRYAECYHPAGILRAALHYVDLVEIPIPDDGLLRSDEYFTLNLQVPEQHFGNYTAFEVRAAVVPPGGREPVEFVFATEPSHLDAPLARFRLEWHTAAGAGVRMNEEEARANLLAAHDRLGKCFRHAFTEKGWALFEPEEP
jgi:uncharacterized protein (TIGR04255 family)